MVDNLTIRIEELAKKEGSYIDAVIYFADKFGYADYEDIIEVVHPLLKEKIKQEFISKKYIPALSRKDTLENFF